MPLTNAQRQAAHRDRQRANLRAYQHEAQLAAELLAAAGLLGVDITTPGPAMIELMRHELARRLELDPDVPAICGVRIPLL